MKKYVSYVSLSLGIIIFLGCIQDVYARDIRLTATVNKNTLSIHDRLELTLSIHGVQDSSPPSFPDIEGFTLLFGPRISAQTRIINGDVSISKGYTYVLQPTAKGRFTIGPSTLEYNGKTYSSSPITVEVVESQKEDIQMPDFEKLVFVELSTDKEEAYIYEQVILSFKFYFQKGLPISDINYVAPTTKNFMEEKLGDQRQYEEIRDGIIYNVLELRTAIFPMVTGELTISPAKLSCDLIIQQRRDRRSSAYDSFFEDAFFDSFFGREQKRYPIDRSTKPITMRIKPLPEQGKSKEFASAVGTYNMSVSIKPHQVKVGDPITLSISIYGEGNIQMINEPSLMLNNEDDFKCYPAESTKQITNREERIRGRKVFSKVIEPLKTDLKFTPAVVFSYFDPDEGQYKTVTKEPMPIIVEAGQQELPIQLTLPQDNASFTKQHVPILTHDILPIMANISSLKNQGRYIYKNPFIIACLSLPTLAVVASLFITKHKERLQTDAGYARGRRAHNVARKRLEMAQAVLSQNTPADFYSILSKAVADYIADKFNIPAATVSGEGIVPLLQQRGIGDDIVEEISNCFIQFDYRRFSSDGGTEKEMGHSLKLAEQLITRLEKQL
ncbi:MAG: protein BatD [wastewater metagenome]|nr:protein BatD [Candidatus Loosdrechtia aerotolerans]